MASDYFIFYTWLESSNHPRNLNLLTIPLLHENCAGYTLSLPGLRVKNRTYFPHLFPWLLLPHHPFLIYFLHVNCVNWRGQGGTQLPVSSAAWSLVHLLAVCTGVTCTHIIKKVKIKNYDYYVLSEVTAVTPHVIIYSPIKGF